MGQLRSITRFARLALLLAVVQSWRGLGVTTVLPNEPIAITHWDSDNGLPPGPAAAIHQTRDGYLWFGMEEGLGRFDGVRCTVYDTRNVPELKVNAIPTLFEDRKGALWIGTAGGGLLRLENDRMTAFGQ